MMRQSIHRFTVALTAALLLATLAAPTAFARGP
jgi:hypothetical protein